MIDIATRELVLQQVGTQYEVVDLPLLDSQVVDVGSTNEAHQFTVSQHEAKEYPTIFIFFQFTILFVLIILYLYMLC